MAWIEKWKRAGGGTSMRVPWRPGVARGGPRERETFGSGTDEQNLARAEGFKKMGDAAGQHWPDSWVEDEGFVRARGAGGDVDPMLPPPAFDVIGEEYVRQIVDITPGQRKRYRSPRQHPGPRRLPLRAAGDVDR
jgi:hypothetical protein